ncbi:MAG: homocysteine S-methyltransferase [Caldilineaceae bacterium]|nr:homocysteine S-methyltransferase [Caldilineaceae bacterium]
MEEVAGNPITPFLDVQRVVILDGAMATELERRGADLRDALWSAKLLMEDPGLIRQVHYDYFVVGADVATSASYQATFEGFARRGLERDEAAELMRLSVALALQARDAFWAAAAHRVGRLKPLVAASVGPYGAYLANGAEYTGEYGLTLQGLMDFHRPRLAVLAESGADLLACETVPSLLEAEALVRLLAEFPHVQAWLSCSCRDGAHLSHGEPLRAVVELVNGSEQVVAVGVNCTAPRFIEPLLLDVQAIAKKPLLVYPNRGEGWDPIAKCWIAESGVDAFGALARTWYAAGARLIGGCCRTTPADITVMAAALRRSVVSA